MVELHEVIDAAFLAGHPKATSAAAFVRGAARLDAALEETHVAATARAAARVRARAILEARAAEASERVVAVARFSGIRRAVAADRG